MPATTYLAVRVTQHTVVSDQLDKMSEYADFPLAGIMRPVYLFRVPPIHIGGLALSTAFDAAYADARLSAHVAVLNESPRPLAARHHRIPVDRSRREASGVGWPNARAQGRRLATSGS